MGDIKCQSLFFMNLPELRKLCTVKVTVSSQLAATESRTVQRKMCRRLMFLHQEVIASPVPGTLNQISVIMTIPFYKSGKCQDYTEKHGATMAMPERVIPAVFQACLSYMLTAKLAPKWNQAGHLLIQGKSFLSQHGKQNAVGCETLLCSDWITCQCVPAYPQPYWTPTCRAKLEDFHISTNIIKKFDSDDSAIIQRCCILSNWCYVLPSMKMGQIMSISHSIPSDSPFQSYSELQLHWKNLYGYSLPEDPRMYCNIYFKFIGKQLFTYPMSCIRSQPVQYFPRVDLEGVLDAFVADVKTIILHTCGFPLKMTTKPLYATKELTQASVQKISSKPANLTQKRNCKVTLTQVIPPQNMFSPSTCIIENSHKMELKAKQPNAGIFSNLNLLRKDEIPGAVAEKVYSKEQWNISKESALMLNSKEVFKISNNSTRKNSTKIIPIFKGKLLQMDRQIAKASNGKRKQNVSQYSPKVMKANTNAKQAVFKSNPVQLDKALHVASLSNANRSIVQIQIGEKNVKSTKPTLKENSDNGGHFLNGALTNRRLNSSLISASDQSTHHASTVQQHLNKPANLSTGHNALTKYADQRKTTSAYLCISHSEMDEKSSTIYQNQIQSSAEETEMNVFRSSSSACKRAKKGGEQKKSRGLNQDTTNTSRHHLQFSYLKVPKSNESLHCEDMNSCHIYSKSERYLTSVPNKRGKRHQELYKTQKNFLASAAEQ